MVATDTPLKDCVLTGLFILGFLSTPCQATQAYLKAGLNAHNEYRALHKSPPLVLDDELNTKADKCADYYAEKGVIDHQCEAKGGSGENLYKEDGTNDDAVEAVQEACQGWYEEIDDYEFKGGEAKNKAKFNKIGHFTQLVWKETQKLGIGYSIKGGHGTYVVALYEEAGNFDDEYAANVLPPVGKPKYKFDKISESRDKKKKHGKHGMAFSESGRDGEGDSGGEGGGGGGSGKSCGMSVSSSDGARHFMYLISLVTGQLARRVFRN